MHSPPVDWVFSAKVHKKAEAAVSSGMLAYNSISLYNCLFFLLGQQKCKKKQNFAMHRPLVNPLLHSSYFSVALFMINICYLWSSDNHFNLSHASVLVTLISPQYLQSSILVVTDNQKQFH